MSLEGFVIGGTMAYLAYFAFAWWDLRDIRWYKRLVAKQNEEYERTRETREKEERKRRRENRYQLKRAMIRNRRVFSKAHGLEI